MLKRWEDERKFSLFDLNSSCDASDTSEDKIPAYIENMIQEESSKFRNIHFVPQGQSIQKSDGPKLKKNTKSVAIENSQPLKSAFKKLKKMTQSLNQNSNTELKSIGFKEYSGGLDPEDDYESPHNKKIMELIKKAEKIKKKRKKKEQKKMNKFREQFSRHLDHKYKHDMGIFLKPETSKGMIRISHRSPGTQKIVQRLRKSGSSMMKRKNGNVDDSVLRYPGVIGRSSRVDQGIGKKRYVYSSSVSLLNLRKKLIQI